MTIVGIQKCHDTQAQENKGPDGTTEVDFHGAKPREAAGFCREAQDFEVHVSPPFRDGLCLPS